MDARKIPKKQNKRLREEFSGVRKPEKEKRAREGDEPNPSGHSPSQGMFQATPASDKSNEVTSAGCGGTSGDGEEQHSDAGQLWEAWTEPGRTPKAASGTPEGGGCAAAGGPTASPGGTETGDSGTTAGGDRNVHNWRVGTIGKFEPVRSLDREAIERAKGFLNAVMQSGAAAPRLSQLCDARTFNQMCWRARTEGYLTDQERGQEKLDAWTAEDIMVFFERLLDIQSTKSRGFSAVRQCLQQLQQLEFNISRESETKTEELLAKIQGIGDTTIGKTAQTLSFDDDKFGDALKSIRDMILARLSGQMNAADTQRQAGRSERSRKMGIYIRQELESHLSNYDTIQALLIGWHKIAMRFHESHVLDMCLESTEKDWVATTGVKTDKKQSASQFSRTSASSTGTGGAGVGNGKPKGPSADLACRVCGLKGHPAEKCRYSKHPNANHTEKAWKDSRFGRLFAKCSEHNREGFGAWTILPRRWKIDQTTSNWENKPRLIAHTGKGKRVACHQCVCASSEWRKDKLPGSESIDVMQRTMYRDLTMDVDLYTDYEYGSDTAVSINLAIDSQSVPSNFINRRVRQLLGAHARTRIMAKDDCRIVCSVFEGECVSACEECTIAIGICDTTEKRKRFFNVTAYVIDSPQDVTIGTQAMIQNADLTRYLLEGITACREVEVARYHTREAVLEVLAPNETTHSAAADNSMRDRKVRATANHRAALHQGDSDQRSTVTGRKRLRLLQQANGHNMLPAYQQSGKAHDRPMCEDSETDIVYSSVSTDRIAGVSTREQDVTDNNRLPSKLYGDEEMLRQTREILETHAGVFSRDLRQQAADITSMSIEVNKALWEKPENRRSPRIQSELKSTEIRRQVDNMLRAGVITPSKAAFYSQVLLVKKSDGSWRFCVDYRRLNQATTLSSWPIPNITALIERLGSRRAQYFGVMDLTKGYYQAPLRQESRSFSAFITPQGIYEWTRVAMGLCGAPSYFQQQMQSVVLEGLVYQVCEVYLDDIIVFGTTAQDYLANVATVLSALERYNITVNPDKCRFGLEEVEFVGHTFNREGKSFTRAKLQKAVDFPTPGTQGELRSFLGVANYFRDHIREFSMITAPLQAMIDRTDYRKSRKIQWNAQEPGERALRKLKQAINECPTLFFIENSLPVHLFTDASDVGFGAYLCQRGGNGTEVPIAFMSRIFTETQRRWSVPEREAYGLYAAIKKFDYLIRDRRFTLHTDHANLIYIRDSGSPKIIRWKLELQEHDFELVHVPGKDNHIADYMSRNELAAIDDYVPESTAICSYLASLRARAMPEGTDKLTVKYTKEGIPQEYYGQIGKVHNALVGHHGVQNTLRKLQESGVVWKYQRHHVKQFIKECDVCQKMDRTSFTVNTNPYTTGGYRPFEVLNVDTLGGMEPDTEGNKYAVVIIDTFSRFAAVYPVKDTTAESAADAIIKHMGIFVTTPCIIKHDGGPDYGNKIVGQLIEMVGAERLETVAHSHEENSIVERANKEIARWLREILYDKGKTKSCWSQMIPFAMRIHNATLIETIGYSPAEIVFGTAVTADTRIFLPRAQSVDESIDEYMKKRLMQQETAVSVAKKRQEEHDLHHISSKQVVETKYSAGDLVLLAWPITRMSPNGRPSKLDALYRGPYKVLGGKDGVYQLLDLVTGKPLDNKSVHALKPFYYDSTRTDPLQVALKDNPEMYLVEEVLNHRGVWSRKDTLMFRVKWRGFSESENTWEPWHFLRDTAELHAYLRKVNRSKFIPKKITSTEGEVITDNPK